MTINDIRQKQFEVAKKGYAAEEVDSFKREIAQYVESIHNEKADLMKKMEILATKIEEYRQDESSIQDALLGAQKLGKKVLEEAKAQAAALTQNAQEKADQAMMLAKTESEKLINDSKAVAQELLLKAKSESQRMIGEAQQNVDTVIRNTKYDIDKEQATLIRMQKEVSSFKAEILELYRKHIDLIKDLPELEAEEQAHKNDEARALDKRIYEQQENVKIAEESNIDVQGTVEFKVEPSYEEPVEEEAPPTAEEIAAAKHDILQDTVEIAKENYTRKFGDDLQFGGKHD